MNELIIKHKNKELMNLNEMYDEVDKERSSS